MGTDLKQATSQWAAVLGGEHVIVGDLELAPYERSTFEHHHRTQVVIRPGSVQEIQGALRVAAEYRIPIYPISRGRNWGYGSKVASCPGAVVMDLGRMNRISGYDPELGCITVEPGVTQQQLVDFLAANGGTHWADTTSVTPQASVLGNIMERGHGLTPYADHVEFLAALEVVLGDGQVVRTGHGRFGADSVLPLDRFTAGPSLVGLFTQSSFAVATKATIWLMPKPQAARALVLDAATDEEFFELVAPVRDLRLRGTIASGPRIANVYRGLMFSEYPWDLVPEGGVLAKKDALELSASKGRGAWRVCCAAYGSEREVQARVATIEDAVRPVLGDRIRVFDPTNADDASTFRVLSTLLTGQLVPGGVASTRTYWRKKERPSVDPDPDRDRCGVIWLAPVTAFRRADIEAVQSLVEEILPRHGFEPDLSAYCLRPRALHYHISIIYDRNRAGEDGRARRAHDELLTRFMERGYPPHRLGLQSMFAMDEVDPAHRFVLRRLKKVFDPAEVISPGRYLPGES